jgi:hypothetical protein
MPCERAVAVLRADATEVKVSLWIVADERVGSGNVEVCR